MRIVLLGAQGSGKGTQAEKLSAELNIPHISTGDIFRDNIKRGTELGRLVKEYADKGLLVPDEVTIRIMRARLEQEDCSNGFILDGFPRNMKQAKALEEFSSVDRAISLEISDEEAVRRIAGRRNCPKCGRLYHMVYNPPKEDELCDVCHVKLVQRDDDKPEAIKRRLGIYHKETEPLKDFYKEKGVLLLVDGSQGINDVFSGIMKALSS